MPSEMAMAVIKGVRMAIMQRQTTTVFVLCRNKFSVARKSRFKCLFNVLNYDIIIRNYHTCHKVTKTRIPLYQEGLGVCLLVPSCLGGKIYFHYIENIFTYSSNYADYGLTYAMSYDTMRAIIE